jgi:hypothetical protein
MNSMLPMALGQLVSQAPVLIALFVGIILAIVYLGRCPGPSVCALIACTVLLLTGVGLTLAQSFLIQSQAAEGRSHADMARILSVLAIGGAAVRAGAYGLLLAAVFMGRSARPAN